MTSTICRFFSSSCVFAVVIMHFSSPISAATISMIDISGTGARNFSDSAIWSPSPVPGTGDFPVMAFGNGTTDYVYVDSNTTVQRINVGNALSGGLEIRSGATLSTTVTGASQSNIGPGGAGAAGATGVGHLRILPGATLSQSGLLYLGLNPNGTGTVTLSDTATHTVGAELAIRDGTGTYNMLGGSLTVGSFLQVARNGHGTFSHAGGTLKVNQPTASAQAMFIAQGAAGATGLYEISGGSLTVAGNNLGVVNGSVAGNTTGTFRIVGSAPTVTIGSNYVQNPGSKFETVIGASGISPMNIGGNATLNGVLGVSFTATPTLGQQFTIMNYVGTLAGAFSTFDNLVDSPQGPDSVLLSIGYGAGTNSSIVLTVVPEPSSIALVICNCSLGLLMFRRRYLSSL